MPIRPAVALFAILLALALLPTPPAEAQRTCDAEIQKFCADVPSGEGKVLDCLLKHSAELSDACRAHVNTAQIFRSCIDDVVRLCPGTEAAVGAALPCLRRNMTELSSSCRNDLRRIR